MLRFNIRKTDIYSNYKAEFFLFLATLLWGTTFPVIKILLQSLNSIQILFYRFFISFILLLLTLALKKTLKINLEILFYGTLTGILGYLAYYFQTEGLRYTTPPRSAFFTQMFMIFVFAIEFLIFKRTIHKQQWFGFTIILLGAYILFFGFDVSLSISYNDTQKGDILTIVAAFCYALYIIFISQIKDNFLNVLLIHFFVISLPALIFLDNITFELDQKTVLIIGMLSLLATFFPNIILFNFQPKISSIKGSILYSMEPVFAFIFSLFLTKDTYSLNEYIGSFLIFFGCIYGSLKNQTQK